MQTSAEITDNMPLQSYAELVKSFPCFASLTDKQCKELLHMMHEVKYATDEMIVSEHDLIDAVYLIISGDAEVTRAVKKRKGYVKAPVAALHAGEAIGLNDTGFFSSTGKRTATVTALTDMLLLRLDIKDLYLFLKRHNLELSMYAASLQMLRMRFIKQSLPFSKLSHERLQWLADHVQEELVRAGTVIFKEGDEGKTCYLIRSGEVEITIDDNGTKRQLAVLKPPVLFGEATLITHTTRNATATATTNCELLVLQHEYLSELLESEDNVAHMFMSLMVDRSRPLKNPRVTTHERITPDGQELTILKNPENGSYFKLSKEGAFIWQQLDGENTLQDITMAFTKQFKIFAPDVVAALISKLMKSDFIVNIDIANDTQLKSSPLWVRAMVKIRRLLEVRYAFGDADIWVAKIYERYIRFLFTSVGKIFLAILAIAGFASFIYFTPNVFLFFSEKHASLLLLLALIPLSLIEALLHELGHAFAVKAFGREVHYIGVGWYWFAPIAFTDTSDMWLSKRRPRMLVNLAGIYVDILVAGCAALLMFVLFNPYMQALFWLFALYTYIGAFRMLSPLQEMDGYYVLMDFVEKPRLRQSAVLWLVKQFPHAFSQPNLFRKHWPEVSYWLACILYLILVSVLTLAMQAFVFKVLEINANPYISLFLPFMVIIFSSLSIIADIRNQAED